MIVPENGLLRGDAATVLSHSCVVLACGIDIRVTKHVGNQIDVAGFAVQIGTEGAAQFMRADFLFERRSNGGIYQWDGCDSKGNRVASGVYMVQTAKNDGSKGTVCKVAIIR